MVHLTDFSRPCCLSYMYALKSYLVPSLCLATARRQPHGPRTMHIAKKNCIYIWTAGRAAGRKYHRLGVQMLQCCHLRQPAPNSRVQSPMAERPGICLLSAYSTRPWPSLWYFLAPAPGPLGHPNPLWSRRACSTKDRCSRTHRLYRLISCYIVRFNPHPRFPLFFSFRVLRAQ